MTMTLYGDLDVSTLADRPPGRQNVHTYLAAAAERPKWWDFFRRKLREGRQAYVIVPLVEESREIATANLEATFEELAHGELEDISAGAGSRPDVGGGKGRRDAGLSPTARRKCSWPRASSKWASMCPMPR